ncbi:helix-turn-helix domain-containing protein [Lujinxingia vulgaris]|uniref:Helix-turn-helix domain-containing protein n=1 Tax=Lujinxingia vulgaris TaxID=2600176 RepID=A0A5C6XCL9_9DELT|nr:helix-turn-helix domain-containing protein [Lujinxingia vulgaris]TXD39763.1 helix-turn-helix domain-containing protein [Lujinxingia vulgaris]
MSTEGLSDSRRVVLDVLRQHRATTIDALVEETGLSKTAVRAHLVRLERDGAVERTSLEHEGPGRPPVAFSLTEQGAALFPSSDAAMLSGLLKYLKGQGAGELVEGYFAEVWADRAMDVLEELQASDFRSSPLVERLRALEAVLTRSDFMPRIEREVDGSGTEHVRVCECNCPLPAAAQASRAPCRLEVQFLSEVIGARPSSVNICTRRREPCVFEFRLQRHEN